MHSYNGSSEITKSLLKLNANFYFSISLGITKVSKAIPFEIHIFYLESKAIRSNTR